MASQIGISSGVDTVLPKHHPVVSTICSSNGMSYVHKTGMMMKNIEKWNIDTLLQLMNVRSAVEVPAFSECLSANASPSVVQHAATSHYAYGNGSQKLFQVQLKLCCYRFKGNHQAQSFSFSASLWSTSMNLWGSWDQADGQNRIGSAESHSHVILSAFKGKTTQQRCSAVYPLKSSQSSQQCLSFFLWFHLPI